MIFVQNTSGQQPKYLLMMQLHTRVLIAAVIMLEVESWRQLCQYHNHSTVSSNNFIFAVSICWLTQVAANNVNNARSPNVIIVELYIHYSRRRNRYTNTQLQACDKQRVLHPLLLPKHCTHVQHLSHYMTITTQTISGYNTRFHQQTSVCTTINIVNTRILLHHVGAIPADWWPEPAQWLQFEGEIYPCITNKDLLQAYNGYI